MTVYSPNMSPFIPELYNGRRNYINLWKKNGYARQVAVVYISCFNLGKCKKSKLLCVFKKFDNCIYITDRFSLGVDSTQTSNDGAFSVYLAHRQAASWLEKRRQLGERG